MIIDHTPKLSRKLTIVLGDNAVGKTRFIKQQLQDKGYQKPAYAPINPTTNLEALVHFFPEYHVNAEHEVRLYSTDAYQAANTLSRAVRELHGVCTNITARIPANAPQYLEHSGVHLNRTHQSKLGHFIAQQASLARPIIVETHNEHLFNGIRTAVLEKQIEASEVHVYWLERSGERVIAHELNITSLGGLNRWPKGLFDQIETDLGRLSRARRTDPPPTLQQPAKDTNED